MIPRADQIEAAKDGYSILRDNLIVYLAMQERTGKSLAAVLITEMCNNVEHITIVTKNKAVETWHKIQNEYSCIKKLQVTTYTSLDKTMVKSADLVILDEAHNFIAGSPKPSKAFLALKPLLRHKPLIYISATPYAQGYHQLYHQFALSSWSPWTKYNDFYTWFEHYGISSSTYVQGVARPVYVKTQEKKCKKDVDHLFIIKTRKKLGFEYEPKDIVHYVELDEKTKQIYNDIITKKVHTFNGVEILFDTVTKRRFALHMLEGGVLKHTRLVLNAKGDPKKEELYWVLENDEKIRYIKKHWGDAEDLVIFYNFKAELIKLEANFKKARILQATAFAEGVELASYEHLVVYSQDYSTARHVQRRARQASKERKTEINVHFLLAENAVSEQVYEIVTVNKENFVDSLYADKLI